MLSLKQKQKTNKNKKQQKKTTTTTTKTKKNQKQKGINDNQNMNNSHSCDGSTEEAPDAGQFICWMSFPSLLPWEGMPLSCAHHHNGSRCAGSDTG